MSPQSNKSAVSAQPLSSVEEDGLDERKNRPPQSSYALDVQALLTRAKLSEELNKMGYPVAAKTLATKASRGGGPPYVLFGRRVLYRWGEALSWAEGRLTAPRCSSSEGDATNANDQTKVETAGERPRRGRSRPRRNRTQQAQGDAAA